MKEFPGTDAEKMALYRAARDNCACERSKDNMIVKMEGCHDLLNADNDVLSRLVFIRRLAPKLIAQEYCLQEPTIPKPSYTPRQMYLMGSGRRGV